MNRRDKRRAKIAHQKLQRCNNDRMSKVDINEVQDKHRTLFDRIFHKKSGSVPVKCQGIYSSVFCKG